jgi:sporulation protein YlmC with PRC-barrel domain
VRLDLGRTVGCTDAAFGELADVVVDPAKRRVTHLVVHPRHHPELGRLVPIERVRAAADGDEEIALDCALAEMDAFASVHEVAFLRLGELPVHDPDWEVGATDLLALPGPAGFDGVSLNLDPEVTVAYDRVPRGEVEIRRESAVTAVDGEALGRVDGFLADDDGRISHLLLEHGHLWGRRQLAIPVAAIARVETDEVVLAISKDDVGALPSRPAPHRRH